MRHDEIEELLGAYALDAVDDREAGAVELHLRECGRCRAEVQEHREVAAMLAHGGASAPEDVWERIAGSLEQAPPPAALGPLAPELPRRRWLLPAALAAAAAVIAVLGIQVVRLDQRVDDLPAAVGDAALASGLQAALLDPAATRVQLSTPGGGPGAHAVLLPDGRGYLVMQSAEVLPAASTYQLWGVTGEEVVSLGVLGRSPQVVAFTAATDVQALAVTVERAGGVARSAKDPVMSGDVRRPA